MCALVHVHRVQRLTSSHKQTIPFRATKGDIAANLRQQELADALTFRRKDVNAIIAFSHPARFACPLL